jgi:hypothetical protein
VGVFHESESTIPSLMSVSVQKGSSFGPWVLSISVSPGQSVFPHRVMTISSTTVAGTHMLPHRQVCENPGDLPHYSGVDVGYRSNPSTRRPFPS